MARESPSTRWVYRHATPPSGSAPTRNIAFSPKSDYALKTLARETGAQAFFPTQAVAAEGHLRVDRRRPRQPVFDRLRAHAAVETTGDSGESPFDMVSRPGPQAAHTTGLYPSPRVKLDESRVGPRDSISDRPRPHRATIVPMTRAAMLPRGPGVGLDDGGVHGAASVSLLPRACVSRSAGARLCRRLRRLSPASRALVSSRLVIHLPVCARCTGLYVGGPGRRPARARAGCRGRSIAAGRDGCSRSRARLPPRPGSAEFAGFAHPSNTVTAQLLRSRSALAAAWVVVAMLANDRV